MYENLTEQHVMAAIANETGNDFVKKYHAVLLRRVRRVIHVILQRDVAAYDAGYRLLLHNLEGGERDAEEFLQHVEHWQRGHAEMERNRRMILREKKIEMASHGAVCAVLDAESMKNLLPAYSATFHASSVARIDLSTSSAGQDVQIDISAPAAIA